MFYKSDKDQMMCFGLKPAGKAQKVHLAGDFTGWKPVAMARKRDGSYAVEIPLSKGSHQYKFVVDGQWLHDGDHKDWVANQYGTLNSLAVVR